MSFWLWEYVKRKVYQFHTHILSDLKDAMTITIQENPIAMVRVTVLSTICRMQSITVCERGHVKHSKILYFMLLFCPSGLSSLLAYLAPVIFVLK